MAGQPNNDPGPVIDPEGDTAVQERTEHKLEKPRLYKVLLHNDDYTTMEFVVWILMHVFHHDDANVGTVRDIVQRVPVQLSQQPDLDAGGLETVGPFFLQIHRAEGVEHEQHPYTGLRPAPSAPPPWCPLPRPAASSTSAL